MGHQLSLSLITGVLIGCIAGYLGSLMLGRRMALVAGPLGHLTLPGIALALIYHFDIFLGAFPFVVIGIVLIWLFEMKTKLPMEALTAVVFASGVAVAFLFLPIDQAEAALIGDISKVNLGETIFTVITVIILFFVTKGMYRALVLTNISEDLAKSDNISTKKYNFVYLLLIAVTVTLGVKIVGGLLTAGLIAIPAAAARNMSRNLSQYAFGAMIIGALATFIGIVLFKLTGLPAGPLSILAGTVIFFFSMFFKR